MASAAERAGMRLVKEVVHLIVYLLVYMATKMSTTCCLGEFGASQRYKVVSLLYVFSHVYVADSIRLRRSSHFGRPGSKGFSSSSFSINVGFQILPKGFHTFNEIFLAGTVEKIVRGGEMDILSGAEIFVFEKSETVEAKTVPTTVIPALKRETSVEIEPEDPVEVEPDEPDFPSPPPSAYNTV